MRLPKATTVRERSTVAWSGADVTRIRFCDKNAALEKAMKHDGLYDKDNSQQRENLKIQVLIVGPP